MSSPFRNYQLYANADEFSTKLLQNAERAKEEACKVQRGSALKDVSRNCDLLGPGAWRCRTLR